jgi:hypothetical protein
MSLRNVHSVKSCCLFPYSSCFFWKNSFTPLFYGTERVYTCYVGTDHSVRYPMTGSQGLVAVLHLNSVPQRRVQLQFQRTTHPSPKTLGRPTSGPSLLSMPNKERYHRPRTFYPIAAFSMGTRPFSWKGAQ